MYDVYSSQQLPEGHMCQAAISSLLFLGKRLGVPMQPWYFEHKSIIPAVPCPRGIWSTLCAGSSSPAGFEHESKAQGSQGVGPAWPWQCSHCFPWQLVLSRSCFVSARSPWTCGCFANCHFCFGHRGGCCAAAWLGGT